MGKRGIDNVRGMRGRKKGGQSPPETTEHTPGTLSAEADRWAQHLADRAYSERTLQTHKWAMLMFLEWTSTRDITRPDQLTRPILEAYQRHLARYRKTNGELLGVTTQRARLGALQRFFAWLCRDGVLLANPAADLELPRQPHRSLPRGLSREEVLAVLSVPDVRDPLGVRDRAILETLYASGVRRSELVKLDLSDLDLAGGILHVRKGKGGRDRVLPIAGEAVAWLSRYLEECRPRLLLEPSEQALFISGYGERISSGYLGNWVRKVVKEAGCSRSGSCHLLRHSCATHMLEGGADVRLVQQMLGHARLDTTAIYTEVAIAHLRDVHARTHPSGSTESSTGGQA